MEWRTQSGDLGTEDAAAPAGQEPLKSRAYDALVLDIIVGDFPPSGRMEEAALARKHGVGLAGVRDALNRLSLEGLVFRQPRFGTIVTPIEIDEVQQALEARRLIEPHIARRAARRAAPGQVRRMSDAMEAATAGVRHGDYRQVVQSGRHFYGAMGEAGGNAYLLRALLGLYTSTARLWIRGLAYRDRQEQLGDVDRHLELAGAIGRADADEAQRRAEGIIKAFQANLQSTLGVDPAEVD